MLHSKKQLARQWARSHQKKAPAGFPAGAFFMNFSIHSRSMAYLDSPANQCLLDFGNCLGDLDSTWARFGAVKGRAATPYAFL